MTINNLIQLTWLELIEIVKADVTFQILDVEMGGLF